MTRTDGSAIVAILLSVLPLAFAVSADPPSMPLQCSSGAVCTPAGGSAVRASEYQPVEPSGRQGTHGASEVGSTLARTTSISSTGGAVVSDGEKTHGAGSPVAPRALPAARGFIGSLALSYRNPTTVVAPEPTPKPVIAPTVVEIIQEAAQQRGANAEQMIRVARCESSLNPAAVGDHGTSYGLFMFHEPAGTWAANSVRYGHAGASPFDPVAASDVAAAMFSRGQAHLWTCR